MGTATDPLTQLPYAYDNNNPAVYTDPTGMVGTIGQACPVGYYAVNGATSTTVRQACHPVYRRTAGCQRAAWVPTWMHVAAKRLLLST
jgi:hypothetical protein